jgi:hypothetical protein
MAHKNSNEHHAVDDIVFGPDGLVDVSCTLEVVCKDIGEALEKYYPGWLWSIAPNEDGGVINIYSLRLSGEEGYVMHISKVQGADRNKRAMEVGGHILERYGLPRMGYTPDLWKRVKKDILGAPMSDITDNSPRVQKQKRDRMITEALNTGALEIAIKDVEGPHGGATRHISIREGNLDVQE